MADRGRTDRIQAKLHCVLYELQDGQRMCGDTPAIFSAWGLTRSILSTLQESVATIAQLENRKLPDLEPIAHYED